MIHYIGPLLPKRVFNPIGWLVSKYNLYLEQHAEKLWYADRNRNDVVIPFVGVLGCKYEILDNLVLIKYEESIAKYLVILEFNKIEDPYKLFDSFVYNRSYNIELAIIPAKYWTVVTTAVTLVNDLKIKDVDRIDVFKQIYFSLLHILEDDRCI